ncbi:MAG: adenosine deaminase [Clostridia bacterium]|nr:adenosine deaminase [Clostridia bacterium]
MIDLHLHLDGSLTPDDILVLADIDKVELPTTDKEELKNYLSFHGDNRTLTHYLTYFDLPLSVMQSKESVEKAVELMVKRLSKSGMLYAEIRFAPLLHTRKGLSVEEVVVSAISGLKKAITENFVAQLILCCMRIDGVEDLNRETVTCAKKYLGRGVCALDLAGNEDGFVYDKYKDLFSYARELKLPITIHAGERGGAEQVEAAIKLGARRIGHGVHLVESERLMNIVLEKGIGVEMCPTSNFQTGAVDEMKDYPLREYLRRGILVCVNTDSTVVSSTNIRREFEFLKESVGLTVEEKVKCYLNALNIAFLPTAIKDNLRGKIIAGLAREAENK